MRKVYEFAQSTVIIAIWLLYPDITKNMFKSLSCINLGDGIQRQYYNVNGTCWQNSHLMYLFIAVIPISLLWVIGVPCFLLYKLRENKELMVYVNDDYRGLLRIDREKVQRTLRLYAFFIIGYSQEYYYWEIVIMVRKTLILLASHLLAGVSPEAQCMSCIAIVVAGFIINSRYRPSSIREGDRMNFLS